MDLESKIYVAGHRGLVGSAIVRALQAKGFHNIVCRSKSELNLCNQEAVQNFFASEKPEYVFLAAAKVGGIHANNTYPAEFIRDNLLIQSNVIDSAYHHACKKLLFLGHCSVIKFLLFTAELHIIDKSFLPSSSLPLKFHYSEL